MSNCKSKSCSSSHCTKSKLGQKPTKTVSKVVYTLDPDFEDDDDIFATLCEDEEEIKQEEVPCKLCKRNVYWNEKTCWFCGTEDPQMTTNCSTKCNK